MMMDRSHFPALLSACVLAYGRRIRAGSAGLRHVESFSVEQLTSVYLSVWWLPSCVVELSCKWIVLSAVSSLDVAALSLPNDAVCVELELEALGQALVRARHLVLDVPVGRDAWTGGYAVDGPPGCEVLESAFLTERFSCQRGFRRRIGAREYVCPGLSEFNPCVLAAYYHVSHECFRLLYGGPIYATYKCVRC
ncbi:hypothetical protein QAD02_020852 [Eretmocerus hayati]|uniref:Uncharacterized protein n=1 Tax=Eretmocerus hayati TaxID=131215 RepID=A0ACC2PN83_9HYME|nr:hypothetical protein QAD02_020852 [Eretmocerus hayati]